MFKIALWIFLLAYLIFFFFKVTQLITNKEKSNVSSYTVWSVCCATQVLISNLPAETICGWKGICRQWSDSVSSFDILCSFFLHKHRCFSPALFLSLTKVYKSTMSLLLQITVCISCYHYNNLLPRKWFCKKEFNPDEKSYLVLLYYCCSNCMTYFACFRWTLSQTHFFK